MKDSVLLPKIEIRNFTPVTPSGDYVTSKKTLKRLILEKISDIDEIKQKTLGKKLFLEVCFYLNDQTGMDGDSQKDLDNLLNVIFDVLPQHFSDEKNELIDGLGLIEDKSDYMIFETHVSKKFVNVHEKEGFDIEISEFKDENSPKPKITWGKRMDEKIFPKSNSSETRITKWIAIYGIIASAFFTFAGVLMGIGISFTTLGLSMQTEAFTIVNSNQTNSFFSSFGRSLIESGNNFLGFGIAVIILGVVFFIIVIIRER